MLLNALTKGESQAKVSRYLGVSELTLHVWLKDKEKFSPYPSARHADSANSDYCYVQAY